MAQDPQEIWDEVIEDLREFLNKCLRMIFQLAYKI